MELQTFCIPTVQRESGVSGVATTALTLHPPEIFNLAVFNNGQIRHNSHRKKCAFYAQNYASMIYQPYIYWCLYFPSFYRRYFTWVYLSEDFH